MIRRIVKLPGSTLKKCKYNVNMTWEELEKECYIIGISASQLNEWLDVLVRNKTTEELEQEHSYLKGQRKLKEMKQIEFMPELIQIEFTSEKQFKDSFKFNGVKYVWLGSKGDCTNTFIEENIAEEIINKLDNGRDKSQKFIPAKLNAYHSLAMSSSRPVKHQPKHVVVVKDNETTFVARYTSVTTQGVRDVTEEVTMESSDGNGIIDYKLLQLWEQDMNYGKHKSSGVSIRNAFIKGMVFPIDLQQFFAEHNVTEIVDVWGNRHSIADVDMIIPTSMHKLWQSYSSWDEYEANCKTNGYEFRVCKESHEIKMGRINYQFTTDVHMNDNQIQQFITPTIEYLKDIAGRDWLSTVLYLNGQDLAETSTNVHSLSQALMLCPELVKDKSVIQQINYMLQKRKNDACVGRYNVESDYQIISSDLYHFLCSACGIESDGLLKAEEIYSQWHLDRNYKEALLFRSPMISKENIARVNIVDSEELRKFYKHMPWTVVLNDWDLTVETLAGADKDGDTAMVITDPTLLEVHEKVLPCKCQGVKGTKVVCDNREVLIQGAILGTNDKKYNIGTCINHITNMFSKRSEFSKDSAEYKELSDRILMGLMISQGYIDFKKNGTVVMEMPKHWYDLKECETDFDKSICADKKPYFLVMYQKRAEETKKNYKQTMMQLDLRANCYWGISAEELLAIPWNEMSDEQREVVSHWSNRLPCYLTDQSTQHKMCLATEQALQEMKIGRKETQNCSHLLKSNEVDEGNAVIEKEINSMLFIYDTKLKEIHSKKVYGEKQDVKKLKQQLIYDLRQQLKYAILDLHEDIKLVVNCFINVTYKKAGGASLLWELFDDVIVDNLLINGKNTMYIPIQDPNGEYTYQSKKFRIAEVHIEK